MIEEELKKALDSGKYFITISYRDVSIKINDLQHWWITKNYPKEKLLNTLDHIKDDVYSKELRHNSRSAKSKA